MNYNLTKKESNKNKIIMSILNILKSEKFPFVLLFIIMIYIHIFQKMQSGDDFWFQSVTKSYSFLSYLKLRYMTWTGRMGSEAIFYFIFRHGGFMWRVINPLIITLFAYGISRIVLGKNTDKNDCLMNWYICLGWLFISKAIILDSVIWITGSVVYIWSMTFALLAIIPFRDVLIEGCSQKNNILYLVCAIFASTGEEQVSLVLVAFAVIINIHIYIRDKKVNKFLIGENLLIIAGAVILFIAPGNFVRSYEETINWLPNLPLYSKWEVGFYGVQWLLNMLLNNGKIIFLLLLTVLTISIYIKNKRLKNKLFIIIPIIGCVLLFSSAIFSINTVLPSQIAEKIRFPHVYYYIWDHLNRFFFDFNVPSPFALRKITIIKFFLWPVIIALVPYLIWQLYDNKTKGSYVALMYVAGVCSSIVMFVSPTMYASGSRTFFVLATMFLIVFLCLLNRCNFLLKNRYVCIFATFAMLKLLFIFCI